MDKLTIVVLILICLFVLWVLTPPRVAGNSPTSQMYKDLERAQEARSHRVDLAVDAWIDTDPDPKAKNPYILYTWENQSGSFHKTIESAMAEWEKVSEARAKKSDEQRKAALEYIKQHHDEFRRRVLGADPPRINRVSQFLKLTDGIDKAIQDEEKAQDKAPKQKTIDEIMTEGYLQQRASYFDGSRDN